MQAKLGSTFEDDDKGNHSSLSDQRLQNLELELAQTKLALVESQCKNQELEHKVKEASSSQRAKNWPFSIEILIIRWRPACRVHTHFTQELCRLAR